MRKVFIIILALAAGGGTAVLPALASSAASPPTITATDFQFVGPGGSAPTVTVAAGDSVAFTYPSGSSTHNVDFGNHTPSSCSQTAGLSSGPVPPLPARPTPQGWSGTCVFSAPGTYNFHCDLHSFMTGSVVVQDATPTTTATTTTTPTGTTTTSTGTTTTSTTSTSTTPTSTSPATTPTSPQPPAGQTGGGQHRPRLSLVLPRHQAATTIRFTVRHGKPGEIVTGEVRLGRRVITRVRVRIGRTGTKAVALQLPARIRRHLHRGQVLKLTVELHSAEGTPKAVVSVPS